MCASFSGSACCLARGTALQRRPPAVLSVIHPLPYISIIRFWLSINACSHFSCNFSDTGVNKIIRSDLVVIIMAHMFVVNEFEHYLSNNRQLFCSILFVLSLSRNRTLQSNSKVRRAEQPNQEKKARGAASRPVFFLILIVIFFNFRQRIIVRFGCRRACVRYVATATRSRPSFFARYSAWSAAFSSRSTEISSSG